MINHEKMWTSEVRYLANHWDSTNFNMLLFAQAELFVLKY